MGSLSVAVAVAGAVAVAVAERVAIRLVHRPHLQTMQAGRTCLGECFVQGLPWVPGTIPTDLPSIDYPIWK